MKSGTVQIAWHGSEPVLSVDFHPVSGLLATAGADHDIKLWVLRQSENPKVLTKVIFEANLSYHSTAVNVLRFSPSGEELASGADGGEILLWRLTQNKDNVVSWKVFKTLRFHPKDILDLGWSRDGSLLASGSVDNTCIIWDVAKGAPQQIINDHLHYVQGVAWDPAGRYLASMSADRTCRIYSSHSHKGWSQDKKAYVCQHVIMKADLTAADTTIEQTDEIKVTPAKCHLFLDENMPSFFRRLAWSPDGSFLLVPAGVYKAKATAYAISRTNFSRPVFNFSGVNKAVVAVQFCPVIFTLLQFPQGQENSRAGNAVFKLPYRLVFAIATLDSVAIYDTQQLYPIFFLGGVHYAAITDLAWSFDGKFLVISSHDGYCTIIEFDDGELGQIMSLKEIPQHIASYLPGSTLDGLQPCAPLREESERVHCDNMVVGRGEAPDRPTKSRRITPVAQIRLVMCLLAKCTPNDVRPKSSDVITLNKLIEMYGKSGSVKHARSVFDSISMKDSFSWVLMLSAYSRNGYLGEAKCIFNGMPQRNLVAWNAMLAGYAQNGHLEEAQQMFDEIPQRDLVSWTSILAAYAQNGNLVEAKHIFRVMPQRNLFSWTSMLTAYAQNGHLEEAKHIFHEMPQKNLVSWTSMLTAYAQNGHLENAKQIFDEMPQRSLISWTSMLGAYAHEGLLEEAKQMFDEMPQQNLVSWTSMLAAYAQNGHLEEARQMFDEMPLRNLVSWNCMLGGYAHEGHLEEAKQIFDEMPQKNLISWSSMLAAYAHNGHLENAKQLFDEMPHRNLVSWTSMLVAYAQEGHLEEAKQMFDEMPLRDLVAWTSMVAAYAQAGHEEAKQMFGEMPQRNVVSWTCMIAAYAQKGHLQEASEMFYEMPQRNLVSWTSMLAAYAHNGHLEDAKQIFDEMPQRNRVSWNSILVAYAQEGHLQEAKQMFDEMKMIDMPDEVCFITVLIACSHEGKVYASRCCFNSMQVDYGVEPTKQHYCCMLDLLGRAGYLDDAEDLITNMPFVPNDVDWMCFLGACRSHNYLEHGAHAAKCVLDFDPKNGAACTLLANLCSSRRQLRGFTNQGDLC